MTGKQKEEQSILVLGVAVEVLYRGLIRESVPELHAFLLLGGLWAVGWSGVIGWYEKKVSQSTEKRKWASVLLFFGTMWGLFRTAFAAGRLCEKQFFSEAFWGILPLLLLLGGETELATFPKTANVLCGLLAIGGLLCGMGLYGQFHWSRLFVSAGGIGTEGMNLRALDLRGGDFPLCPEYFLFPFLWKKPKKTIPSAKKLPFLAFGLEFALFFGRELLLGRQDDHGYTGVDVLQSWEMGVFSRMDSAFLFLWMSAALVRICFLCAAAVSLFSRFRQSRCPRKQKRGEEEIG